MVFHCYCADVALSHGGKLVVLSRAAIGVIKQLSDRLKSFLMGHFGLVDKRCYSSNVRIVDEQEKKAKSVASCKWENSVLLQISWIFWFCSPHRESNLGAMSSSRISATCSCQ